MEYPSIVQGPTLSEYQEKAMKREYQTDTRLTFSVQFAGDLGEMLLPEKVRNALDGIVFHAHPDFFASAAKSLNRAREQWGDDSSSSIVMVGHLDSFVNDLFHGCEIFTRSEDAMCSLDESDIRDCAFFVMLCTVFAPVTAFHYAFGERYLYSKLAKDVELPELLAFYEEKLLNFMQKKNQEKGPKKGTMIQFFPKGLCGMDISSWLDSLFPFFHQDDFERELKEELKRVLKNDILQFKDLDASFGAIGAHDSLVMWRGGFLTGDRVMERDGFQEILLTLGRLIDEVISHEDESRAIKLLRSLRKSGKHMEPLCLLVAGFIADARTMKLCKEGEEEFNKMCNLADCTLEASRNENERFEAQMNAALERQMASMKNHLKSFEGEMKNTARDARTRMRELFYMASSLGAE